MSRIAVDKARELTERVFPSLNGEQRESGDLYRYSIRPLEGNFSGILSIVTVGVNEVKIHGSAGSELTMVNKRHCIQSIGRRVMLFEIESDEDVNEIAHTFVKMFLEIYE